MEAFDSWAGTFARPVTRMELAPEGGRFRLHTRIAAFDNVPELLTQFRSFADLLADGDIPALAVPDLVGGRAATVVVDATAELADVVAGFAERAERIRSRLVRPDEDNMLVVCNDGRLASLDLRLVGREQPHGTGKLPAVADRVAELWAQHRDRRFHDRAGQPSPTPGALQLVFCDKGTPGGDRFNAYDELRRLLTERGLDPARIRFIHDAGTDQAKARLFAACRHGDVDVLIGSTEKMGTGVNVQHRLVALHHVDVPWRPADIEQREGRILRQGNQNPAVHIVRYVTTGSFDPYMWGTVERKARFIAQITAPLDAADTVRSVVVAGDPTTTQQTPRPVEVLDATTQPLTRPARCSHAVLHSWEAACHRGSVLSFGRAVRCRLNPAHAPTCRRQRRRAENRVPQLPPIRFGDRPFSGGPRSREFPALDRHFGGRVLATELPDYGAVGPHDFAGSRAPASALTRSRLRGGRARRRIGDEDAPALPDCVVASIGMDPPSTPWVAFDVVSRPQQRHRAKDGSPFQPDDAPVEGNGDRRRSVVDSELGEDVGQVGLDRGLADVERPRDVLVRSSVGHQRQHLQLPGAERLTGRRPHPAHETGHDRRRQQ